MQQPRLRQPPIARSPQVSQSDPLRECPFNSCPLGIDLLKGFCVLALAGLREGFIGFLRSNHYGPLTGRTDTLRAVGARPTIRLSKANVDDWNAPAIALRPPNDTGLSRRTGGL